VIVLRKLYLRNFRALLYFTAGELVSSGLIHLAFNPEFLREGSAIRDYYTPPYTVIGTEDSVAKEVVQQMYAKWRHR